MEDQPFGQLIEGDDDQRKSEDAAIGLFENEINGSHEQIMNRD